MMHDLKTEPAPFAALWAGDKTAEWRRDDRGGFAAEDMLRLREWDTGRGYTGREVTVLVTHVERGYGVPEGWCVMSVKIIARKERAGAR